MTYISVTVIVKEVVSLYLLRKNSDSHKLDNINLICNRNNIEYIFGKIWLSSDKFTYICSLYSFTTPRGCNYTNTEPQAWFFLLQHCSNFDPVVICGVVNEKSSLWSSNISGPDQEGSKLENAISQLNLSCLNDGNYIWSFIDFSSISALDITVTSPSIAHKCTWNVPDKNYGSDHYPITITISNNVANPIPSYGRPSFITAKVDWHLFQLECSKFVHQFHVSNDLNSTYDNLINAIHLALLTSGARK